MAGKDHYYNKAKQEGSLSSGIQAQTASTSSRTSSIAAIRSSTWGRPRRLARGRRRGGRLRGTSSASTSSGSRTSRTTTTWIAPRDMTEDKTRDRVIDAAGARSTSSSPTWHPTCPEYGSIRPARAPRTTGLQRDVHRTPRQRRGLRREGLRGVRTSTTSERTSSKEFQYVRATSPKASRDESSEVYFIGKGRLTATVRPGGRRTRGRDRRPAGNEGDAWHERRRLPTIRPRHGGRRDRQGARRDNQAELRLRRAGIDRPDRSATLRSRGGRGARRSRPRYPDSFGSRTESRRCD